MYYTIKGRDRTENAAVLEQHQTLVFIAFQVFSRVFFVFLHCVQDRPASYIVARASNRDLVIPAAAAAPNRMIDNAPMRCHSRCDEKNLNGYVPLIFNKYQAAIS